MCPRNPGAITNRRLYDGDEMIVEYNAAGAIARRIVHGPGVDEPLVWYGSGGTTRRFLHADERGSIVSATDVNGAPIVTYRYDEYGGWGTGNSGRYYYTGQSGYDELRLYYYKNRWYNPAIDRFMQTDPSGYADGMNLYAYVGNDPVNRVDPRGDRGLTNAEREMLRQRFGDLVNADIMNLHRGIWITYSHVGPGRAVYFNSPNYVADFSQGSLEQKRTFWHEFYHVFELHTGRITWGGLIGNLLWHGYDGETYAYDHNKSFLDNNPEARAKYFADCVVGAGPCGKLEGTSFDIGGTSTVTFKNGAFRVTTRKTGNLAPIVRVIRPSGQGKSGDKPAKPEKGKPKKK